MYQLRKMPSGLSFNLIPTALADAYDRRDAQGPLRSGKYAVYGMRQPVHTSVRQEDLWASRNKLGKAVVKEAESSNGKENIQQFSSIVSSSYIVKQC